jgi:hypothetical protein
VAVEDHALVDIDTYETSSYALFYLAKSTKRPKKERKGGQTSNKIDEKGVIIDVYT